MGSVLFYKEIVSNDYAFGNELLEWVRLQFPETNVFDTDSLTESFILDTISSVLIQSEVCLIILDCPHQSPVSNLMPLMEEVWKSPDKYHIMATGNNTVVSKILSLCKHDYTCSSADEQKIKIRNILSVD